VNGIMVTRNAHYFLLCTRAPGKSTWYDQWSKLMLSRVFASQEYVAVAINPTATYYFRGRDLDVFDSCLNFTHVTLTFGI
jgi:hypothetical protein